MPDAHEVTLAPWSAGPWSNAGIFQRQTDGDNWDDVYCIEASGGDPIVAEIAIDLDDAEDARKMAKADADLIALAPEMAEAILSLCDYWSIPPVMQGGYMRELADRLRAIGGDHA